jgi:hypothetical protein
MLFGITKFEYIYVVWSCDFFKFCDRLLPLVSEMKTETLIVSCMCEE